MWVSFRRAPTVATTSSGGCACVEYENESNPNRRKDLRVSLPRTKKKHLQLKIFLWYYCASMCSQGILCTRCMDGSKTASWSDLLFTDHFYTSVIWREKAGNERCNSSKKIEEKEIKEVRAKGKVVKRTKLKWIMRMKTKAWIGKNVTYYMLNACTYDKTWQRGVEKVRTWKQGITR